MWLFVLVSAAISSSLMDELVMMTKTMFWNSNKLTLPEEHMLKGLGHFAISTKQEKAREIIKGVTIYKIYFYKFYLVKDYNSDRRHH